MSAIHVLGIVITSKLKVQINGVLVCSCEVLYYDSLCHIIILWLMFIQNKKNNFSFYINGLEVCSKNHDKH